MSSLQPMTPEAGDRM